MQGNCHLILEGTISQRTQVTNHSRWMEGIYRKWPLVCAFSPPLPWWGEKLIAGRRYSLKAHWSRALPWLLLVSSFNHSLIPHVPWDILAPLLWLASFLPTSEPARVSTPPLFASRHSGPTKFWHWAQSVGLGSYTALFHEQHRVGDLKSIWRGFERMNTGTEGEPLRAEGGSVQSDIP